MFFFRPKVINVDCFTSDASAHTHFPIDYTYKFFPEWWKKLPKTYMDPMNIERKTIKKCVGFNSFFKKGLTIPMWCDLKIDIMPDEKYLKSEFSSEDYYSESHNIQQMKGYLDEGYFHIKLISPWIFRCKENVDFVWTQHTWNFSNPSSIIIPPAVVDYKYQSGTNINMFVNMKQTTKNILIEAGQPMINIVPLSDQKLKIHHHLVSSEELRRIYTPYGFKFFAFNGLYDKIKKMTDERESSEKKCPFGF
jgi:hypothetical protein